MTFFYNLNDKLNAIREKPETTHGQLNERDMGKHNNKTTGFDALAKKAGKEYGSKAAGERVAGAQFQKMKKSGKLEEEGMSRAAKGYEKYGKQGMQALAKAGREGKALDPVRNKYDKYDNDKPVDETIRIMANPEGSKFTRGTAAYVPKNSIAGKTPQGQAHRDATAAMAKAARAAGGKLAMNKTTDVTGKRVPGGYDALAKGVTPYRSSTEEGLGDVVKKVGGMAKKVGGAVLNRLGHGDDQSMRKDLQRKMGVPQTGKKPEQKTDEAAKYRDPKYKDKLYTQEPPDYENDDYSDDAYYNGPKPDDYAGSKNPIGGGEFDHNDPLRRGYRYSAKNSINTHGKRKGMPSRDQISSLKGSIKAAKGTHAQPNLPEAGAPMSAKQKSFAALAPPKDKITFADKIAGAKKEVDEMLGDVAAEAIKSALSPKQKKIDMNKNGKLDANDFAMLRKGGNKQVADEGFDDMEKDVKSRMSARRVGDVTHGDKHDTQEIPGGRRVTRRVNPNTGYSVGSDSDAEGNSIEKRGRGRPKGPEKAPERVTGKATKHKGGRKTNENDLDIADRGEYDQEGDMAKDSIKTVVRHAQALEKILGDNDNLPEWVQSKLAKIEGMMTAVDDYMQNQEDDEMAMGEEKTSTRDNRAERAGRKVAKDIEYDEKKKDGIHGKKRGSEDDRAEKAGKKVAKDIEHDEKKKKVKEQGGTDTPTASSGFGFGQGIYDSMNRELETMIRESMNISMSMNTDTNGGPSRSVTVTATDDDAMKLGELLKNAGLGGDHAMGGQAPGAEVEVHGAEGIADQIRQAVDGDDEVCDACGQQDCGCETVDEAYGDDVVSQNSPDYPTNTETAQDNFEYSGGLNGPKSTGQSTVPVLASQEDRQHTYEDDQELHRMMEMAGVKKKEVDEEKTEEGNLFTKGLADNDVKVGEKIPGTDAVKKKDIDEGILASTASLWKQYKGQYGV